MRRVGGALRPGASPGSGKWKQGAAVRDNPAIAPGTAIATFINGIYPSNSSGNHAALFLAQEDKGPPAGHGLWVVDQYFGSNGIHKRLLRFKGKHADGNFIDPVNNGDAFSVIE
ncbi:MAG: BPSL0067 family protein [Rhodopila sp.]